MTSRDIAALVRGLTDAQKDMICRMDEYWRDRHNIDRISLWKVSEEPILQIDGRFERLTPLGLRVREALLSDKARGE